MKKITGMIVIALSSIVYADFLDEGIQVAKKGMSMPNVFLNSSRSEKCQDYV